MNVLTRLIHWIYNRAPGRFYRTPEILPEVQDEQLTRKARAVESRSRCRRRPVSRYTEPHHAQQDRNLADRSQNPGRDRSGGRDGGMSYTHPKNAVRHIEFEDNGQDFTDWWLDAEGRVIDCQPFQYRIWVGSLVQNPTARRGKTLTIQNGAGDKLMTIKHRVWNNIKLKLATA